MKFLRLDLLTLLISLFILGSCKNQNDIGLPPDDQQINGTLVVDNNVVVNTVTEDPVPSGGAAGIVKTPLTRFSDNQLGETVSNIAASIDLPVGATSYTLPVGVITTDSAVLELRYADGFYGDSLTSKYKVNVYQLSTERPNSTQVYYSNKTWAHGVELIGGNTQAFNARPKTPVRVMNIIDKHPDTLHVVSPHIRVPISTAFINKEFFGAPASHLASNAAFQNAVKGLYLTLQHNQASEAGGTIMLNLDSCRINVYYRTNNAGTLDTAVVSLPFTSYAHAAEVTHNYSADVLAALDKGKNNPTQSSDVFYLQGGSLRAKVSFPNLESLFGTTDVSKVALNRAELVITPAAGTTVPFVPAPQLTMYRSDIALQRQLLPDANGTTSGALDPYYFSTAIFGGQYDKTKQQYRFVVTGYLQNLLKKKMTDYGTYIAPIDSFLATGAIPIAPTIQTAGRTVAIGSNASSANRIKLNIIYSK